MSDLSRAKELLSRGYTYALVRGKTEYAGKERGIAPLLGLVDSGRDFSGFSAADKIVGKAAALLYAYLGVSEVYGEIMSAAAPDILDRYSIVHSCGVLTEGIVNRKGDGLCPMEQTVTLIDDPVQAYIALKEKVEQLKKP